MAVSFSRPRDRSRLSCSGLLDRSRSRSTVSGPANNELRPTAKRKVTTSVQKDFRRTRSKSRMSENHEPTEEWLFNELSRLESPQQREEFLNQACRRNAPLRTRIERLYFLRNEAERFFDFPLEMDRSWFLTGGDPAGMAIPGIDAPAVSPSTVPARSICIPVLSPPAATSH